MYKNVYEPYEPQIETLCSDQNMSDNSA